MNNGTTYFIYAFIGFCSIFIPAPIIRLAIFVILLVFFINKIKEAKQSEEGFESLKRNLIIILLLMLLDVGLTLYTASIEENYFNFKSIYSPKSENIKVENIAEEIINSYKSTGFQKLNNGTYAIIESHYNVNKFKKFLQDEYEIMDATQKENEVTCKIENKTVIFRITKYTIKYRVV